MTMKTFKAQLDELVGIEHADELLDAAKKCVRYGFRQWAWYKAAEHVIMRQVGFNDLVTEVIGEIMIAERDGLEWQEAVTMAQKVTLQRLRPQFSFEYGHHGMMEYDERLSLLLPDAVPPHTEESEELRAIMEEVLTPFQLEVVETVAAVGGTAEAARILGLNARQQVTQALRLARKRLVKAGISPS